MLELQQRNKNVLENNGERGMDRTSEQMATLRHCSLFAGMQEKEITQMLDCLGATVSEIPKGQWIFLEGDPAEQVGVVLSGEVQVVREDYYGRRSIVTDLQPGELFAEVFACAGVRSLPVSVVAVCHSEIMLINCKRILSTCSNACEFHNRFVSNLLRVVAEKNIKLNQKIELLSQKTTRQKLMSYLLLEAKKNGDTEFSIPYDRQGLADYLGVERSAMSAEISRLRRDGIIECKKNRFQILRRNIEN